jgi:hypothetical protein
MNFRWNQLLFSHHIGEEEWWRDGSNESVPSTNKTGMNFRWNQLLFRHHIGEEEWWREGEESLAEYGGPLTYRGSPNATIRSFQNDSQNESRQFRNNQDNQILRYEDSLENFSTNDSRADDIASLLNRGGSAERNRGRKRSNSHFTNIGNGSEDLLSTVRSIETCYLDRSHHDQLELQDVSYTQCLLTALTHSTNIRSVKLSNLSIPILSLIELFNNCSTIKQFIMFQAATTSGSVANSRDDNDATGEDTGIIQRHAAIDLYRSNSIIVAADEDPTRSVLELAKAIVSCQSLERIELLHNVLLQNVLSTTKENSDGNGSQLRRQLQEESNGSDNYVGRIHSCIHLAIAVLQCVRRQAHLASPYNFNSYKSKICHFHAGPWKLSFDIGGVSTCSSSVECETLRDAEIPLKVSLEYDVRKESDSSDSMRINELFAELSLFGSGSDDKTRNPISELRISMVRSRTGAVVANQDDNDNSAHDENSTMNRNVIMSLSDLLLSSSNAPQSIHLSGIVFDEVSLPMLWRALSSSKGCLSLSFSYCWFNVDIHQPTVQRQLRRRIDSLQYLAFIENSCRSDSTATLTNSTSGTISEVNLIERIVLNLMQPSQIPTRHYANSKSNGSQLQILRCTGFSAQAISAVFEEIIYSDLRLEVLDFGSIQSPPFDCDKVQSLCKYVPMLRRLKHLRMSLLTSEIPDEIYHAVKKNSSLERFDVWEAQSNLYYQFSGVHENSKAISSNSAPYALQNKRVERIISICERNKCLKQWLQQPDSVPEYMWVSLFHSALDLIDTHDTIFRQLMSMGGNPPIVNSSEIVPYMVGDDNNNQLKHDRSYDEGEEDNAASWLRMIRATITALT